MIQEREKLRRAECPTPDEAKARAACALKHECPDCGGLIQIIPAKEMHPAHSVGEIARRCLLCTFMCFIGDDPLHHKGNPDPRTPEPAPEPEGFPTPDEDKAAFERSCQDLYEYEHAYWEGQMAAWEWRRREFLLGYTDEPPLCLPPLPPFPCFPTLPSLTFVLPRLPALPALG
jgi:hypothetical protein